MQGPRCVALIIALQLAACAAGNEPGSASPAAAEGSGTLQQDLQFTDYTPLSGNAELLPRMLSPLALEQIRRALQDSGKALREQEIRLPEERFALYLPSRQPRQGYALLVFVPPWQAAKLPQGWAGVLDQYGVIFVSAARSGNDENSLARREPLALLAAANAMNRYRVDPQRVYAAGFSGGSRVAQRLALGYPDLFRGALLDAGSDPIGDAEHPLPARELFGRFQQASRLVYLSGEEDRMNLAADADSADSMRHWCVFDVEVQVMHRIGGQLPGHEAADAAALSQALQALFNPLPPDPARLAACRSGIEQELAARLQQAEALLTAGKHDPAQKLLRDIDARYGGLAAPRSVELSQR